MAKVRLYIADGSGLELSSALAAVSPARRSKALRCRSEEKQRASLAVELLLKLACGRTDYKTTDKGKPYFEGDPVYFSLSHSGSFALCAVSDRPVGADLETPDAASHMSAAKRFFSEAECESIARSPAPAAAFCSVWVQKEAVVKASGEGLAALSKASPLSQGAICLRCGELYIGLCVLNSEIEELEVHVERDLSQAV